MLASGDKVYEGGAFNTIAGQYRAHLAAFPTQDFPVATLLAEFDAATLADGIELRWSFGDASRVASVTVERALVFAGPWMLITPELREEGDVTAAIDGTANQGTAYFYRLRVGLVDGSNVTFGPAASTASAANFESSLSLLGANPTRGGSQIQYTVARSGHVRLEVADVAGRVVTTLVNANQKAGHFQLTWEGANANGKLPAGIYFVRFTTVDRTVARKIARLR